MAYLEFVCLQQDVWCGERSASTEHETEKEFDGRNLQALAKRGANCKDAEFVGKARRGRAVPLQLRVEPLFISELVAALGVAAASQEVVALDLEPEEVCIGVRRIEPHLCPFHAHVADEKL